MTVGWHARNSKQFCALIGEGLHRADDGMYNVGLRGIFSSDTVNYMNKPHKVDFYDTSPNFSMIHLFTLH